jgi:hypothetical protein
MAQSFQVSTPQGQGFDAQAEQDEIARRRRMADILRQQSAQPEGQMVSGRFVAPSITQRLAGLFNAYQSGQVDRQAGQQSRELAQRVNDRRTQETSGIVAALTGGQRGVEGMPDETGNPTVQMEEVRPDMARAMQLAAGSQSPEARAFVPSILNMRQQQEAAQAQHDFQERMAREAREAAERRAREDANRPQTKVITRVNPQTGQQEQVAVPVMPGQETVLSTLPQQPRQQRTTNRGIEEFNPQTGKWEPTGLRPYQPRQAAALRCRCSRSRFGRTDAM